MTDEVTSELSDVNISSSINATTVETSTGRLTGHGSPAIPVIMRVTILILFTVFNLSGNGFTLITIRLTPRLWTKTNFILASMMVADVITGVLMMFWYVPFLLVVFVFNNPCHYNVLITVLTPLHKITIHVSILHLLLVSVERYIAIVYPLQYETKFTDRTLKWSISAMWATGIMSGMSYALWVINADLSKCDLIPVQYHLVDVIFGYLPVCISMFICHGKILAIAWRQRQRIEPMSANPAAGPSVQTTAVTCLPPSQSNKADNTEDLTDKPPTDTGPPRKPAVPSSADSSELAQQQQQQQQIKSRRREFKAAYLTAVIVGVCVILWFPYVLGRVLASVGYNPVVVNYIVIASGAIGAFNFSFTWAIYAAVSKSYRRAYRQVMIRIGCCCCKNITLQADNSIIG